MAKSAIRNLKARRFWRRLCVEVLGNPEPKQPIKLNRKRRKFRKRSWGRYCDKAVKQIIEMIDKRRAES